MTVSTNLELSDANREWNYTFQDIGGAVMLACEPIAAFSPQVETWKVLPEGNIECTAHISAQCQQPKGFPLLPSQ